MLCMRYDNVYQKRYANVSCGGTLVWSVCSLDFILLLVTIPSGRMMLRNGVLQGQVVK